MDGSSDFNLNCKKNSKFKEDKSLGFEHSHPFRHYSLRKKLGGQKKTKNMNLVKQFYPTQIHFAIIISNFLFCTFSVICTYIIPCSA